MAKLTVRPMQPNDAQHIVDYLVNISKADAERMGLAIDLLPAPEELHRTYVAICDTPEDKVNSFYSVWCVDDQPVGHASLKNIAHGDRGEMHLHMWTSAVRGKGYGGTFFCLSALDFYERFGLRSIICEPRAANPMPNRMLQKVGFPLLKTYLGASSELSVTCELNCYNVDREIAVAYLRTQLQSCLVTA